MPLTSAQAPVAAVAQHCPAQTLCIADYACFPTMEWGRTFLSGSYPVPIFAATQLTFFGLLLSKWTPPCLVPPFLHALNKHWEAIVLTQ